MIFRLRLNVIMTAVLVWMSLIHQLLATYTEFYCNSSTGNQMNGGSDTGSPSYTATNGGWNSGTGVFTPTSGNPSLSVTVGQYAAVFTDGTTTPSFVGRVTAANSTTVTVSVTLKIGTIPTTAATGISIRVGGVWKGPNAADAWPVGSVAATLTTSTVSTPRVNLKNNATYSITTGITQSQAGVTYQGYSTSVGDGGRATIDGSTNAIVVLTISGAGSHWIDSVISNNGTTGSSNGITITGVGAGIIRCVIHDIRGSGVSLAGAAAYAIESEAYLCNTSNSAALSGFIMGGTNTTGSCVRCNAHDNSGANGNGFGINGTGGSAVIVGCIADTNGNNGVNVNGTSVTALILNSDFYNNAASGIDLSSSAGDRGYIENCNFVKNGAWGVKGIATAPTGQILVLNNGFGSGTQVNTSGTCTGLSVTELSSVTYASNVTPWVDPANGDFRINVATAVGTGRGSFMETQASYTGSAGNPVIGAVQVAAYPTTGQVTSGVTYANGAYTGTAAAAGVFNNPSLGAGLK